jgi:hypothetical protein
MKIYSLHFPMPFNAVDNSFPKEQLTLAKFFTARSCMNSEALLFVRNYGIFVKAGIMTLMIDNGAAQPLLLLLEITLDW